MPGLILSGAPFPPNLRFPAIRYAGPRRQKFVVARKAVFGGIRRSYQVHCLFGDQCFDGQQAPFAVVDELQTELRVPTQSGPDAPTLQANEFVGVFKRKKNALISGSGRSANQ